MRFLIWKDQLVFIHKALGKKKTTVMKILRPNTAIRDRLSKTRQFLAPSHL